jgi:hypothetical protein
MLLKQLLFLEHFIHESDSSNLDYMEQQDLAQSTSYQNISFVFGFDNDQSCQDIYIFLTQVQQLMLNILYLIVIR